MIGEEERLELRLRIFAPPAALALAWLVTSGSAGRSLARIFAGMWLHELGHAATAWWCGFFAVPGPWRTMTSDHRSLATSAVLLAALVGAGVLAQRAGRIAWLFVAAGLVVLQTVLTLFVRQGAAGALILFGGDAGAMVFGTLLMATFFARPGSRLQTSWLRWGFLVLGALAFMDVFRPWWAARRDPDAIAFGEIEGVGDSDPTGLVDAYHWDIRAMVTRFVTVGVVCLLALAAAYVAGVLAARRRVP